MSRDKQLQATLKRAVDIILASVFILFMGLPMVIVGLVIRISSSGPALFKQKRPGKDGELFTLYKFRSMKVESPEYNLFHDEDKLTAVGKIIRKWRIDEMPQAFNVLLGDMSLVGPRPTLPYQVERYTDDQKRRLSVKPGMTGWAQINGDKAITWPERIELDLWYVDHWSLLLDIMIIMKTPLALLKIRRINTEEGPPKDGISAV